MTDAADRARLFRQLVGEHADLVALRDVGEVEIVELWSNGDRVDVRARSGSREWHVVFSASDGERADWVHVYERPPQYAGVPGGRAVIVNGPSSSGKSTVLQELRERGDVPWVVFDEPMFGDVRTPFLIWREQAPGIHRGFLDGIAALARAGNCVATAAGGHPQEWFDAAFDDIPTIRVGLDCPAEELTRREEGRADVRGGLAEQSMHVHDGWDYDLRFDTGKTSAREIVDAVLRQFG